MIGHNGERQLVCRTRRTSTAICTVLTMTVAGFAASGAFAASGDMAEHCTGLAGQAIGKSQIDTAEVVAATDTVPEYCSLAVTIPSEDIHYGLRLPFDWNGKTYMSGVGGFQGQIKPPTDFALAGGYVDYATDSGHSTEDPRAAFVADFALGNDRAILNFAYESYYQVAVEVEEIVADWYGKAPKRSYFQGCSGSGRIALVMAQRYPDLFDGIIAGAPAPNFVGDMLLSLTMAQASLAEPGGAMTEQRAQAITSYVAAKCDALDGLEDGIVSNPRACDVPVGQLQAELRLTDAETNVVKAMTTPIRLPNGAFVSNAFHLTGNESGTGNNWWYWLAPTDDEGTNNVYKMFGQALTRNWLVGDPNADPLEFEIADYANEIAQVSRLLDAWPADLTGLEEAGGMLIIWNGYADPIVSYQDVSAYYEDAVASVGGADEAADVARFYGLPGVLHCGGGVGPSTVDWLAALDDWVENDVSPDTVAVTGAAPDGESSISRPLCAYPSFPRYKGEGEGADPASFECVMPN